MKKIALASLAALMLAAPVYGQEAPPPKKAPRTPVHRQVLPNRSDDTPVTGEMRGTATILDSEKLRIGDVEFRLFGVVPPQLAAAYGPQARAALDELASGQAVNCQIRDRDRDGRYFGTCRVGTTDLALELLRRGLAVAARGSVAATDLATTYLAAEQNAQNQKAGLWALAAGAPQVVAVTEPAKPAPVEVKKPEPVAVAPVVAPFVAAAPTVVPVASVPAPLPVVAAPVVSEKEAQVASSGVVAKYQMLISSLVLVGGAFAVLGVVVVRARREKQDETRAIAAALRGELQAARSVCMTRAKAIATEEDDRQAAWPRLRSVFYQAYIARIGFFGAGLARQIASIYGQANDYASYYHSADESRAFAMPKRQALLNLVHYIDEVLPRLQAVEKTGVLPVTPPVLQSLAAPEAPVAKIAPPKAIETVSERKPAVRAVAAPAAVSSVPMAASLSASSSSTVTAVSVAPVAVAPSAPLKPLASVPLVESKAPEPTPAASPVPFWNTMKKFTTEPTHVTPYNDPTEDLMPDYAALIEQEIASMSFGDEPATDTRMGAFARIRGV